MSIQINSHEDDDLLVPSIQEECDVFSDVPIDTGSETHFIPAQQVLPSTKAIGTKWTTSVFLVVNAALGAGLLNFPQAYDRAGGIVAAVVIQAVLVFFVIIALLILASCADLNGSKTYQDVVSCLCGKRAQQLCSIGIVLYCYGTCITFLIIIGDQFDRIFASLHGADFCHHWYFNRNFTLTASSILFVLPLCFSRRIDFLKYPSSLGVLAIIYVVILIVYEYYAAELPSGPIKTRPDVWTDVFNVVPVICFGYQCHVSVVPIYACLEERTVQAFSKTVICAIIICVATYTTAGIFGYLTFGSLVPSDILEAYDAKNAAVLIGIIALAIKTFTTYPVLQFCGRTAIESLIGEVSPTAGCALMVSERRRRIFISLTWFITTIAFAVVTPNIGDVIQILGSLAAIFIFVFPGVCWMEATYLKDPFLLLRKDKLIVLTSCCFITLGVFIFGVVLSQAIQINIAGEADTISLCSP